MTFVADAYAHVGLPRYGSAGDFANNMERFHIRKSVMVLFNAVPDFASLFAGIREYPDTIRGVGIPFGRTEEQRLELTRLQLQAGVIGIRMEPAEALGNPGILKRLGEEGRWVFALSPFQTEEISRMYLNWLEQYPQARIASPHLLYTEPASSGLQARQEVKNLLEHPRFHPIFSRQGGLGSAESYPHRDFLPWMSFVFERAGTRRVMWASEYPVIYSRNESMDQCISWLEEIGTGLSQQQLKDVMHDNTERIFFTGTKPDSRPSEIPDWVAEQFNHGQTVRIYNRDGFELPLEVYGKLLNGYLHSDELRTGISFSDYFVKRISLLIKD